MFPKTFSKHPIGCMRKIKIFVEVAHISRIQSYLSTHQARKILSD